MSTPLDARGPSGPVGKHDFRLFVRPAIVAWITQRPVKNLHTATWCAVCRSRCGSRLPCRCCLKAHAAAVRTADGS